MKICFVCNEYPPGPHGGIGTLVQLLARGLQRRGHTICSMGIYRGAYLAPDLELDEGIEVHRLRESRIPKVGWLLARVRLYRKVAAYVARRRIDLVEVPDYQGMAALWPRLPVPVLVRLSGSGTYNADQQGRLLYWVYRWLEHRNLLRADFVTSESHYLARETQRVFSLQREVKSVVYNPVELPALDLNQTRGLKVVFFGTLNYNKGIVELLQAWPEVLRQVPTAQLHVFGKFGQWIGGTPIENHIQREFGAAAPAGVTLHGLCSREQLLKRLPDFRIAVFPSKSEGFALAPLEAMAHGCATVFTKRASGPELIEDGVDGLLVDPERPTEIAAAIVRLLKDPHLANRLGRAGRNKIQHRFTLEKILADNESLFATCIEHFTKTNVKTFLAAVAGALCGV